MSKNQFRRGQRVVCLTKEGQPNPATADGRPWVQVEVWRYGSVTNPKVDSFGSIRVRMDSQQDYETGFGRREIDVRPAPDDRNEYERRHYDLRYLTHDQIAALKTALERVNYRDDTLTDDMVQTLLRTLPTLP
jgi:hypothetical protein